MDHLLERATALGQEIANDERVKALVSARQDIEKDTEAQQLVRDHSEIVERIAKLKQAQKPIEPGDKRKLAECEASMAAHALFKRLLKAQANYLELMNRVHHALEAPLIEATEATGGA
ncbi:MAG: YlbF family regulator [Phycisphaerae bacterium]